MSSIFRFALRGKLVLMGIVSTVFLTIVLLTVAYRNMGQIINVASEFNTRQGLGEYDRMARDIELMCEIHYNNLQEQAVQTLATAYAAMQDLGDVSINSKEMVEWNAIHQLNQSAMQVKLPKFYLGRSWLGQTTDFKTTVPLVDDVQRATGSTCTIFQRLNAQGDMLRVATNVPNKNGHRAIGTYIPAVLPDGTQNPVIAAILQGRPYKGRAFVVTDWYSTAYRPIFGSDKQITGMLYTGVLEKQKLNSIKKVIMDMRFGRDGYVYVLHGRGDVRGQYVVSKDGKRDGESLWDAKDADGKYFIQEICQKAAQLQPGQTAEVRYPWKNQGDTAAKWKTVRLSYFQPWDWVIGVGVYDEDLLEGTRQIQGIGLAGFKTQVWLSIGVLLLVCGAWWFMAGSIAGPLNQVAVMLGQGADQTASASQVVASGASQQASSLEQTSASLEQITSMSRSTSDRADQAKEIASEAMRAATVGTTDMDQMAISMEGIKQASAQISKIIRSIDEIAFQTNLLALNAAVEAARAGEAGLGFSVVADEVRNLARRSAEAAKETATRIEDSVKRSEQGMSLTSKVGESLKVIAEKVKKLDEIIMEIAEASKEQRDGVGQISVAVNEMDKVTQSNAASAQQLSAQVADLKGAVKQLMEVTGHVRRDEGMMREASAKLVTQRSPLTGTIAKLGGGTKVKIHQTVPRPSSVFGKSSALLEAKKVEAESSIPMGNP
ncbi:MAG: methyl-accepting chemotaxis protein [Verrucomicrobiae bacterium]|nr:methyl-accepting chemotaxis protein [Verrucomicrobiae bacterium]